MWRCPECGAFNRVPAERPANEAVCGRCKKPLPLTGAPQEVDGAGFDRAVASAPVPVLVDFWAPWCPPCRAAGPIIEHIAKSSAGKLVVLKVNTQDHPQPSAGLGIQGIPTFVVFREGREVARQVGLLPAQAMAEWVAKVMA